MKIKEILENEKVVRYLEQRSLIKQYKKVKQFILLSNFSLVNFKKRKPKKDGVYYFRINKQFRALAFLEKDVLIVFDVDNHQN